MEYEEERTLDDAIGLMKELKQQLNKIKGVMGAFIISTTVMILAMFTWILYLFLR